MGWNDTKEIMLWNVCICLRCSKHFLSLFPIHTFLVHASHWRLQLITVHASKITIKIFLLEVELHNNSLYELCSTTWVVTLILFHLYPLHGFANRMVPAQPEGSGRALPVTETTSMGRNWTGSLSAHYRPCHFTGTKSSQHPTQQLKNHPTPNHCKLLL